MENKMYCKPIYKCGICGKEHDDILDRAKCEMQCVKKQEEEAKKAAEAKKKEEYEARQKEVTEAIDHTVELFNEFIKDYRTYHYDGKFKNLNILNMYDIPTKLLSYFSF